MQNVFSLCKASIETPSNAGATLEKPPSEPKESSKHQVTDDKLMARARILSKKITTLPKAAPKDVDAAGDVSRSDDSATTTSEKDGSGSEYSATTTMKKDKHPAEPCDVIIPSKKVTTLPTAKAASKAVPKDPDAAGDVEVSDDSATTTSEQSGAGSDTNGAVDDRLGVFAAVKFTLSLTLGPKRFKLAAEARLNKVSLPPKTTDATSKTCDMVCQVGVEEASRLAKC